MPVEEREVDGIEGLLHEALDIARTLPAGQFLWYRGLADGRHSLVPKLLRDGRGAEEIFERERRLLTRFKQRSLPYWQSGYFQTDWDQLFTMQHFGVPTRLLDWSENLFVAAHFALTSTHDGVASPPVVWCLNPIEWNRATPAFTEYGDQIQVLTTSDEESEAYRPITNKRRTKSPVALFGTHNSDRIVAQRGTFVVWGNDARPLEAFANETANAKLWRLEIRGDRASLANQLRAVGFTETIVFPELSSLASELTRVEGWRN